MTFVIDQKYSIVIFHIDNCAAHKDADGFFNYIHSVNITFIKYTKFYLLSIIVVRLLTLRKGALAA